MFIVVQYHDICNGDALISAKFIIKCSELNPMFALKAYELILIKCLHYTQNWFLNVNKFRLVNIQNIFSILSIYEINQ